MKKAIIGLAAFAAGAAFAAIVLNRPENGGSSEKLDDEIDQAVQEKLRSDKDEYLDVRREQVVRHFRFQNPEKEVLTEGEAEKYYDMFSDSDDILDEFFWRYCCSTKTFNKLAANTELYCRRVGQPDPVKVMGYTADDLHQAFNLKTGNEQYFWLLDLRKHPQETLDGLNARKQENS